MYFGVKIQMRLLGPFFKHCASMIEIDITTLNLSSSIPNFFVFCFLEVQNSMRFYSTGNQSL